jgi:sterol desaturase/sphingolipid hydroxylase (fatty acid hydroxylase superfamily)
MALASKSGPTLARRAPWLVTWGTWPVLFLAALAASSSAAVFHWSPGRVLGGLAIGFIVVLASLELAYPFDPRWRMTWRTVFGRDIKYFLSGFVAGTAINYLIGLVRIHLSSGRHGLVSHWPIWLTVPAVLIALDFVQYWQHRWSHEANGPLKRFLWKTHVAHHLPEQVYVLMHPANHPFNILILQGLLSFPLIYFLGPAPEAMLVASAIINLQSIISHCNVDLRAGWFNYIFSGTELHRCHHSADISEAQNYAVTLSLLDVVFGTFVYHPARPPAFLGVAEPNLYPRSNQFWRVMLIPLMRS